MLRHIHLKGLLRCKFVESVSVSVVYASSFSCMSCVNLFLLGFASNRKGNLLLVSIYLSLLFAALLSIHCLLLTPLFVRDLRFIIALYFLFIVLQSSRFRRELLALVCLLVVRLISFYVSSLWCLCVIRGL